jgi:hypothetical protein
VRKILAALLLVASAACRPPQPAGGGMGPAEAGAPDGPGAVERFLGAARTSDVHGMARLFGTGEGSIANRDPAEEVEKRMRALQCYLTHDGSRLIGASAAPGGKQVVQVELKQRELTRQTRFTVVPGPQRRWFVESFEINSLSDFCRP